MISVLIVDDELLVRIGLKSSINWEKYGFILVGEAKNAMDAYNVFIETRPDILITDITMPGQNGLELISKLKELKPELASVILTHHEDFNFAREAISLGVVDYILKSGLTFERLLKVLNKAKKDLKKEDREVASKTPPQASSGLTDSLQTLFWNFCAYPAADNPSGKQIDSEYGAYKKVLVSVILHRGAENENEDHPVAYDFSGYEKVMDQLKSRCPPLYGECQAGNRLDYIFLSNNHDDFPGLHEKIFKTFQMLGANLKTLSHDFITIGLSRDMAPGAPLVILYEQASTAENRAFFQSGLIHAFTDESDYHLIKKEEDYCNKEEFKQQLHGSSDCMVQFLENLLDSLSIEQSYHLLEKFHRFIINTIRESLGGAVQNNAMHRRLDKALAAFDSLENPESVRMHIATLVETFNQFRLNNGRVETSFIVKKSKKFIETHFGQNITLSNLAENVQVSNSYLSFLFKEELGINFTRYLTQVRIEKAKDLLTGTNHKIYEIAEKTGFDSPFYFSKVFKDITGLTCKEYRRNYFE